MAFTIQYKRLFEVNIFQSYYLDLGNSRSFFELDENNAADKIILEKLLSRYNIWRDWEIVPTPYCERLLKRHKMLFKPTSKGFFIGVEVEEQLDDNGNKVYMPVLPIENDLRFSFAIRLKNPFFINFSNVKLRRSLPTCYYFSNLNEAGTKTYPSLSLPSLEYQSGKIYEMGEVARVDTTIYSAIEETSTAPTDAEGQWEALENDFQYSTESDRNTLIATPNYPVGAGQQLDILDVSYEFPRSIEVAAPSFQLLDNENNVVEQLGQNDHRSQRLHQLKFGPVAAGSHTLVVESGSFSERVSLNVFVPKVQGIGAASARVIRLVKSKPFGIIDIHHRAGLEAFRILEPKGYLRMVNVSGGADPTQLEYEPPCFEIRIQNRATYWHYIPLPGEQFPALDAIAAVIPDPEFPERLRTRTPVPLTQIPADVSMGALPSPDEKAIKLRSNGKIYSEIFLAKL